VAGLSDVFGSAQTHSARALNFMLFRTDHSSSIVVQLRILEKNFIFRLLYVTEQSSIFFTI
jgi:hypothetical protein